MDVFSDHTPWLINVPWREIVDESGVMNKLALLDLVILVFVALRTIRARYRSVGDSLHGLIGLLLLLGLLMGARMDHWLKHALTNAADKLGLPPGLGLSLLLIVAVWLLMRVLRHNLAGWLQSLIPPRLAKAVTITSELCKALLVSVLMVTVLQWFYPQQGALPLVIIWIRQLLA